jgi:alpha-glucosidase
MQAFTAGGKRLDSAYNFDFLYAPRLTADLVRASLSQWRGEEGEGWPSWAFSNHDAPRAVSRWSLDDDMARTGRRNLLLLLALRGNPIIYQGEELGLPQGEVAFEDLQDPEAIINWPHTLGRDGARTPMPWQAGAPQAGFSSAARTWLKLDRVHTSLAFDKQAADPASNLSYARALLAARRDNRALAKGGITLLESPQDILAFLREDDSGTVLCVFNLGETPGHWRAPEGLGALTLIATESHVGCGAVPEALAPGTGYWAAV